MTKKNDIASLEVEKEELLAARDKLDGMLDTMSKGEYWFAGVRTIRTGWTTAQAERFKEVSRKLNELKKLSN